MPVCAVGRQSGGLVDCYALDVLIEDLFRQKRAAGEDLLPASRNFDGNCLAKADFLFRVCGLTGD